MKDLLKTYAPIAALAAGFLCYWGYGTVSNLEEQTALLVEQRDTLIEEKNAILLSISNQCTTILTQQGFQVVPPPEAPPKGEPDGEDAR
jgi:hypothetical protein